MAKDDDKHYPENNVSESLKISSEVMEEWGQLLLTGKSSEVSKIYAKDGILIPTMSNQIRDGRESIAKYFDSFLELKPKMTIRDIYVRKYSQNSIGVYGIYIFDTVGGRVYARYTFDLIKIENQWLIEHHHSSLMPEKNNTAGPF